MLLTTWVVNQSTPTHSLFLASAVEFLERNETFTRTSKERSAVSCYGHSFEEAHQNCLAQLALKTNRTIEDYNSVFFQGLCSDGPKYVVIER